MIDSHVHFWKLNRGDYGWIQPDHSILYQDYVPGRLVPERERYGVSGVVVVQAASTVAETDYLLQLADQYPWIAGVVGWVDLQASDFAETIARLLKYAKFKGIRLAGEEIVASNLATAMMKERLQLLAWEGLSLDLLVRPQHLHRVADLLDQVPELPVAVNHLGVPPIIGGDDSLLSEWESGMKRFAQRPEAVCKLSGMIAWEGAEGGEHVLKQRAALLDELFSTNRLLFGSDWPVCLQRGDYGEVVELYHDIVPDHWSTKELQLVGQDNAYRFYRLAEQGTEGYRR